MDKIHAQQPKGQKKQDKVSFKDAHPQFFQVPQGKKTTFKEILNDAVMNKKKTIDQSAVYVKQNSQSHLSEFLKYKQLGLKRLIQSAAFQKTLNDVCRNKHMTRQQAVLTLLYDDFIGDLWKRGKDSVASFWAQNKDSIFDMLRGAALQILPKLLAVGGKGLKSEDPYAIDLEFVRTMFDPLEMSPVPRETLDPLALMKNRIEVPITTGSAGIATVLINPYGMMFYGTGSGVAGQNFYPFAAMSSSNTSLVYNGATTYAGPFNGQIANLVGFLPDQCKVSYVSTQSALNAQGKVTVGLYYTAPNTSIQMGGGSVFDGSVAALTSAEILNSSFCSRVFSIPQCLQKVQHLCRWIPSSYDFQAQLLNPGFATGVLTNTISAFIALSFTGCTPSTTIGNLYLSSAMSFKPVAGSTGIYDVNVRGSYQGTHRWFHQLRKCNVPVQFLSWEQVKPYVCQNFAQTPIGASQSGFCVDKALIKIGKEPFGRPWVTIEQLERKYPGLAKYTYGETSQTGLIVNLLTKHAYVNSPYCKIDPQSVVAQTKYGRSFYTDFQSVYYESPYQVVPFESVSSDVNGSACGQLVVCGVHCALETNPGLVGAQFIQAANVKPRMTYQGRQLKLNEAGIWIYNGLVPQGLYPTITYDEAAQFLQGNLYCPNGLSKLQILLTLLKSGIEPNPGPRALIKSPGSTIRQPPVINPETLCFDCCLRQALLIRAVSRGSDVSDMSDKCDDHQQGC